jgi:hypothetical protein
VNQTFIKYFLRYKQACLIVKKQLAHIQHIWFCPTQNAQTSQNQKS